jgi:hypothetical protein
VVGLALTVATGGWFAVATGVATVLLGGTAVGHVIAVDKLEAIVQSTRQRQEHCMEVVASTKKTMAKIEAAAREFTLLGFSDPTQVDVSSFSAAASA